MFNSEDTNPVYNPAADTDVSTQPVSIDTGPPTRPTLARIRNLPITPPGPSQSSPVASNQHTNQNPRFLHRDNERMRASINLLRDQVDISRRQESEWQTQLSELQNQLRRLDSVTQGLLDIPGVQNGGDRLVNGLYDVLDGLTAMEKTLMSRAT